MTLFHSFNTNHECVSDVYFSHVSIKKTCLNEQDTGLAMIKTSLEIDLRKISSFSFQVACSTVIYSPGGRHCAAETLRNILTHITHIQACFKRTELHPTSESVGCVCNAAASSGDSENITVF